MDKPVQSVDFSRPCFGREEAEAAAAVVSSGWVVGGPQLAELEQRFATLCETKAAVGVSSWTAGAFLVLKCLGIGPGDEVIVPSLTFIASVNVIVHVGATPVFADIDPTTLNIEPDDVLTRITPRTRAILPVDQLGLPCEIDRIIEIARANDLLVIQDAACSLASRYRNHPVGASAPVTIFSLHARKVVTTGEGGMIVTNDEELAERLKRQRRQGMSFSDFERHGRSPTMFESYPEVGYNFRITDIQAAIGVAQMNRLRTMLTRRREIAQRYIAALNQHPHLSPPQVPPHVVPNWQSFQVQLRDASPVDRNTVMERLHARGIATRRGVMATHLEPPYRELAAHLPNTEAVALRSFQLPIFPDLADDELDYVIRALNDLC